MTGPLVPEDLVEARNLRRIPSTSRVEFRGAAQKDLERVYYALSFLRLVGVTQITTPDPGAPIVHNRLTHSLKVAQIARSIAVGLISKAQEAGNEATRDRILALGGLDPEVAAAASLAHDIGHPPFGHAGEHVLDQIARDLGIPDGFEGNAQTFRIVTKTDGSYGPDAGLNFTAATRAAVLKYPWSRPPIGYEPGEVDALGDDIVKFRQRKFGHYKSEEDDFEAARGWLPEELRTPDPCQSLEASVMDVADDITYAVHDFEDFMSLGLINPETLLYKFSEYLQGRTKGSIIDDLGKHLTKNYADVFDPAELTQAVEWLDPIVAVGSDLVNRHAARRFRNNLLEEFLSKIEVLDEPRGDVRAWVGLKVDAWHRVQLLKFLADRFIIQRSDLAFMQAGEAAVLRNAVQGLQQWEGADPKRIPVGLRTALRWAEQEGHNVNRGYLDYVCTLGDGEVEQLAAGLSGHSIPNLWSGPRL